MLLCLRHSVSTPFEFLVRYSGGTISTTRLNSGNGIYILLWHNDITLP